MRKALPYILIVVVLIIAAGFYLDMNRPPGMSDRGLIERTPPPVQEFQDLGQAPEFTGINKWLNSDALTMEGLKGKVVLIDFWTYSCINCVRTLPHVTDWYEKYKDKGLVIVGVHTPEFAFEKETKNVETALKRYDITYPVAMDNDYKTWQAYSNRYWPAEYLVDQSGKIVYTHFGEGNYDTTENRIRTLLGMDQSIDTAPPSAPQAKSPEMYFGLSRLEFLSSGQKASSQVSDYVIPNRLDLNRFALEGKWQFFDDKAVLVSGPGKIKLHFNAAKAHMVASSAKTISVTAKTDDGAPVIVQIKDADLYTLFDGKAGDHVIEISIPDGGFEAFTFTFG